MGTAVETELKLNCSATIEAAAADGKRPSVMIEAYTGGVMSVAPHGAILIELSGLTIPEQIPLLADHENRLSGIVGHGQATIEGGRVLVTGALADTAAGNQVVGLSKAGIRLQASIGARIEKSKRIAGGTIQANGQLIQVPRGGLMLVQKATLREVSFVPLGADAKTNVSIAATRGKAGAMGGETQIFDEETIRGDERSRLAEIDKLFGSAGTWEGENRKKADELRAKAIDGEITAGDMAKELLEILRDSRPNVRASFVGGGSQAAKSEVIEASLCMATGLSENEAGEHFDDQTMNAALSSKYRGAGIIEACEFVLKQDGRQTDVRWSQNRPDEFIRAAFQASDRLAASGGGFSTMSLPGILGNVANKHLLAAYRAVATTWQEICSIVRNRDFKQHTRYRMTGVGEFTEVGETGELKHVSVSEASYTNQIDTFGAMLSLTRKDIINDDLSALTNLGRILGRMSALKLEEAVYTLLLSNPGSFFASGNGNYQEGADTALDIDSLTAAEQLFLDQTDSNGKPILLSPAVLLVPTSLKVTAQKLWADLKVVTGEDATVTDGNPHAKKFRPVATPYLNSQGITGSSSLAWYLFSNPGDIAAIEVAFLSGSGGGAMPTIERGELNFNLLGVQWRAYHDFGVAMQDTRAAVKSKGEA